MRWRAVAGVVAVVLGAAPGATAQHARREGPEHTVEAQARDRPGGEGRDPCAEAIHAAEFEDLTVAEESWQACRARVAPARAVASADALRTLEDVAEAL